MTERAPHFLFENIGSHGDILPLIGIAAELVRRGQRCQLLANEHFRAQAVARGIGFQAITTQRTHKFASHVYSTFDCTHDYFRRLHAFDERTVVISTNVLGAGEPLAEAHGLRTVRLMLFPFRIKSLISPPWPLGARALGADGERFLRVTLPAMYSAAESHPEVLAKINATRAQLGLAPVCSTNGGRKHVVAEAAMFPEWYGMPASDWPALEFLGFPLPSSNEPMPARVLEFLARHPRPLVFTTGTGCCEPERFFEAAAQCCAQLGMPGIFLSRFLRADPQQLGDQIAHFEYVELEGLLRHAALIVHHGGLGTTARALQAGIPQVISPMVFDQPDNGHRVEVLGAGRVVPRERMGGATFAAAVRDLLSDPELGSRLSRYRSALASPRAVERAAELLLNVARRTPLLSGLDRAPVCT